MRSVGIWAVSYTHLDVYKRQALYREFNSREEAAFKKNPANAEKPYKEQKLQEAFICSGDVYKRQPYRRIYVLSFTIVCRAFYKLRQF